MTETNFLPVVSKSGNIEGYGFDGRVLVLKFKSGTYSYTPQGAEETKILEDFVATCATNQSSGSFFHQYIKNNPRIVCAKI